jgi:predicted small secreted protein
MNGSNRNLRKSALTIAALLLAAAGLSGCIIAEPGYGRHHRGWNDNGWQGDGDGWYGGPASGPGSGWHHPH